MSNRCKRKLDANLIRKAAMICNAGCEIFLKGDLDRAQALFNIALQLNPAFYEAWQNLGSTLIEAGRLDEGLDCERHAVILNPRRPLAHLAKAVAYRMQERIDDALRSCLDAIEVDPSCDQSRLMYAHLLLLEGRYDQGWKEHELARVPGYNPAFAHKTWNGEDVSGKRVLLLCEQGFGDDLQFIRYAPMVKALGATTIIGCKPPLARLFSSRPDLDEIVPFTDPPPQFDYFAPLMRLPYIFKTTIPTIPADVPYLLPHPEDVEYWSEVLGLGREGEKDVRVGLCWAGAARKHDPKINRVDQRRSMRLDDFAPLFALPGIAWYSLQVGERSSDRFTDSQLLRFTDEFVDFADTAAFIANLDLVISVDTAVCHLAGALGKPILMLSRFDGCWRWLRDRDDSPWYPSMRIYRQPSPGDWASVIDQVTGDLYQITARNVA